MQSYDPYEGTLSLEFWTWLTELLDEFFRLIEPRVNILLDAIQEIKALLDAIQELSEEGLLPDSPGCGGWSLSAWR